MPEQQPSRPAPNRSNTSYSSRSARNPQLERISSGNHLDDAGHYYPDDESYHTFDSRSRDREDQYRNDEGELAQEKTRETDLDRTAVGVDLEAGVTSSLSSSSSDDTEEVAEVRDGIRDVRDRDMDTPEHLAQRRSRRLTRKESLAKDPNIVTWDGPHDPENPKNWPFRRKWMATIIGILSFLRRKKGEETGG